MFPAGYELGSYEDLGIDLQERRGRWYSFIKSLTLKAATFKSIRDIGKKTGFGLSFQSLLFPS